MAERFVSVSCGGEKCWCGQPAEHKVEEVVFDDDPTGWNVFYRGVEQKPFRAMARHPLTRYICHEHFVQLMGPAAHDLAERQQGNPPARILP